MDSETRLSSIPRGTKRRGDESVESDQRLSKRFNLLNLEQNGKLWIPASPGPNTSGTASREHKRLDNGDSMLLDDTKDRVYIHNLDDELATIEADAGEERLIFLPDIEKKLNKIPAHVLRGEDLSALGSQMVLYNVPTSLTVPVEQDSVRKAILESRARALEAALRVQKGSRDSQLHDTSEKDDQDEDQTEDAMDIG